MKCHLTIDVLRVQFPPAGLFFRSHALSINNDVVNCVLSNRIPLVNLLLSCILSNSQVDKTHAALATTIYC